MGLIKNSARLSKTPQRKQMLSLVESAFSSIQPHNVIASVLRLQDNNLTVHEETFNLSNYRRVVLIGFGKGAAAFSSEIEKVLGDRLTEGFVIDVEGVQADFQKLQFTQGTHPLPSQENADFTKTLLDHLAGLSLTDADLVLVVVCGGGSAMLVAPDKISLDQQINVSRVLLKSGGNIYDMNTVRKHLSRVKGGGLAKSLYPATVATMVFSDVPGNDLSFIASGPTVMDKTTIDEAWSLIEKFGIQDSTGITKENLSETPKDEKYFANVHNQIVVSNQTALKAMQKEAENQGLTVRVFSDTFQSEAKDAGHTLLSEAKTGEVLLAGGETTVKVTGDGGQGGRNQEVVLAVLPQLDAHTIIVSFDSDGWDNSHFAGAIGDQLLYSSAKAMGLFTDDFLKANNSLPFFEQTESGIETGRLPANVSDLYIVYRYD